MQTSVLWTVTYDFQYLEWDYRNRYDRSDCWTFLSNRNNTIRASLTESLIESRVVECWLSSGELTFGPAKRLGANRLSGKTITIHVGYFALFFICDIRKTACALSKVRLFRWLDLFPLCCVPKNRHGNQTKLASYILHKKNLWTTASNLARVEGIYRKGPIKTREANAFAGAVNFLFPFPSNMRNTGFFKSIVYRDDTKMKQPKYAGTCVAQGSFLPNTLKYCKIYKSLQNHKVFNDDCCFDYLTYALACKEIAIWIIFVYS